MVYIVDPFSYGQDSETISRLAMIGLLRCYQQMALPENLANNLSLQVYRFFIFKKCWLGNLLATFLLNDVAVERLSGPFSCLFYAHSS